MRNKLLTIISSESFGCLFIHRLYFKTLLTFTNSADPQED